MSLWGPYLAKPPEAPSHFRRCHSWAGFYKNHGEKASKQLPSMASPLAPTSRFLPYVSSFPYLIDDEPWYEPKKKKKKNPSPSQLAFWLWCFVKALGIGKRNGNKARLRRTQQGKHPILYIHVQHPGHIVVPHELQKALGGPVFMTLSFAS